MVTRRTRCHALHYLRSGSQRLHDQNPARVDLTRRKVVQYSGCVAESTCSHTCNPGFCTANCQGYSCQTWDNNFGQVAGICDYNGNEVGAYAGCDCSGCACAVSQTCDHFADSGQYKCDQLESVHGCDCSGCRCSDTGCPFGDLYDEVAGHGTHVAGTAAGLDLVPGRNSESVQSTGVAYGAKLAVTDIGVWVCVGVCVWGVWGVCVCVCVCVCVLAHSVCVHDH